MRWSLLVEPAGTATAVARFDDASVARIRGAPGRARVPVVLGFEGRTWRTSITFYAGEWMFVVNASMRDSGLVPGRSYEVSLERDDGPREVELPRALEEALSSAALMPAWSALAASRRRELARSVEEAKRPETRSRRIEAILRLLR